MAGCVTFRPGAPEGVIDVIAHRGASAYAPENTLASFKRAIDMDADWFELDCHLSKDGKVVVMHDSNLKRITGLNVEISLLDLADLKKLDAGASYSPEFAEERIPTLNEALQLAKGSIGVYVEIKNAQDDSKLMTELMNNQSMAAGSKGPVQTHRLEEMMRAVERAGTKNLPLTRAVIADIRHMHMEKQIVIQSFSPIVCLIALAEAPEIRTELLASLDKDHPEQFEQAIQFGWALNVDGFNLNVNSLTPEFLQRVHGAGKTVAVWTVDDPAVMERMAGWGVDAIITNRPDLARKVLRR